MTERLYPSPFNIVIAGRAARSLPHDRPSRSRFLEAVLLCDRIEIGRGNVSIHVESPGVYIPDTVRSQSSNPRKKPRSS
jgi:hypothetical protein